MTGKKRNVHAMGWLCNIVKTPPTLQLYNWSDGSFRGRTIMLLLISALKILASMKGSGFLKNMGPLTTLWQVQAPRSIAIWYI